MKLKKNNKLWSFSFLMLKTNWHVLLLFYFIFTLLIFAYIYVGLNANFTWPRPSSVGIFAINLLIILCAGFLLEMKESMQNANLKMRLGRIFTPWSTLKKHKHIDDLRYWLIVFAYYYCYNTIIFLIFMFSFIFGMSVLYSFLDSYFILLVLASVIPNAIFQMFFVALPFTIVLVPTEKSQYHIMLSPLEFAKYTMNIIKPLRWKIFMFFLGTPWVIISLIFIFTYFNSIEHISPLLLMIIPGAIFALLIVLFFFFMASFVLHFMSLSSDQSPAEV